MPLDPQEALGAADDCLQIDVYADVPGRRLLLEHFKDPSPPPGPLLASALHALGEDAPLQDAADEVPVLFECEGCGPRFRDCAAAVCHERVCLTTAGDSAVLQHKTGAGSEQADALNWLLKGAMGSEGGVEDLALPSSDDADSNFPCLREHVDPLVTISNHSASACPQELRTLEGPRGRAGSRLGSRFWERLSLGDRVSWERAGRFFPRTGEGTEEAAERALDFACSSRSGHGFAEADWSDPNDVSEISKHVIAPASIQPAACDADQQPTSSS